MLIPHHNNLLGRVAEGLATGVVIAGAATVAAEATMMNYERFNYGCPPPMIYGPQFYPPPVVCQPVFCEPLWMPRPMPFMQHAIPCGPCFNHGPFNCGCWPHRHCW